MNAGVQHYNLYWKDLQVPDHDTTLHIVQIMHWVIVQGGPERKNKVLVHCHAGQGRTAIIIGAYLLYAGLAKDAEEAIDVARRGRRKLFSHTYNRAYVHEFDTALKELRVLCPDGANDGAPPLGVLDVIRKQ